MSKALRHSDNKQRKEDDNKSPPLGLLQRLLQPVLTNHSSEENDGTTNHLPNTDRNPKETNEHNEGSGKVTEGRNEHLVVHRLLRTSSLHIPKYDSSPLQYTEARHGVQDAP